MMSFRKNRQLIIFIGAAFCLFLVSLFAVQMIESQISADDAAKWTLWVGVITLITATGFSLIQQQAEFQKKRSQEEKEQALKYQYLEQQITNALLQLENHSRLYGHEGVYELLGRVIQVEADHKALLFILNQMGREKTVSTSAEREPI